MSSHKGRISSWVQFGTLWGWGKSSGFPPFSEYLQSARNVTHEASMSPDRTDTTINIRTIKWNRLRIQDEEGQGRRKFAWRTSWRKELGAWIRWAPKVGTFSAGKQGRGRWCESSPWFAHLPRHEGSWMKGAEVDSLWKTVLSLAAWECGGARLVIFSSPDYR